MFVPVAKSSSNTNKYPDVPVPCSGLHAPGFGFQTRAEELLDAILRLLDEKARGAFPFPSTKTSPQLLCTCSSSLHTPQSNQGQALPSHHGFSSSPTPKLPLLLITAQDAIPQLQITACAPCLHINQHLPKPHFTTPSQDAESHLDASRMVPTEGF